MMIIIERITFLGCQEAATATAGLHFYNLLGLERLAQLEPAMLRKHHVLNVNHRLQQHDKKKRQNQVNL